MKLWLIFLMATQIICYKMKDIVRIEQFYNCDNVVRSKHNYYDNISFLSGAGKGSFFINADYEVKMTAKNILGAVEVFKCQSMTKGDCEQFGNFKQTDFCSKIEEKGQFWSPIYENVQPPLKCPFEKITYRIRNATFDVRTLLVFVKFIPDFSNYYWLAKTSFYSVPGKRLMECKSVMFKTTKIRV